MHFTRSDEMLIQKSCEKSWRGAVCKLVQPRILATNKDPHGREHRTFQEEEGFDLREAARRLVSAELRRSSPDSVIVHSLDVSCRFGVSFKSQQKARNMCKPLVNHVCRVILELLRKKKFALLGAPWPVWMLNLASVREVQAVGKLGVMKCRISVNKSEVMEEAVPRKSGFCIRSSISGGAKRETNARNESCRVTKDDVAGKADRFVARVRCY